VAEEGPKGTKSAFSTTRTGGSSPLGEQYEQRLRLVEDYDQRKFHAHHLARNSCLVSRFAFGDLSLEESLRSVELFARVVMPAFDRG
jgi:hypothetical protein